LKKEALEREKKNKKTGSGTRWENAFALVLQDENTSMGGGRQHKGGKEEGGETFGRSSRAVCKEGVVGLTQEKEKNRKGGM